MKTKQSKFPILSSVAVSAVLAVLPATANASWVGDMVTLEWFTTGSTPLFSTTVLVDADLPEVVCPGPSPWCAGFGSHTEFDIGADFIDYSQSASGGFLGSVGTWRFSSLDFGSGQRIESLSPISTNISGLTDSDVTFNDASITINMADTGPGDVHFRVTANPIPLPSSASSLGIGLLALVIRSKAKHRKRG